MDETMLDGNAVAGLLGEVFAGDMTTAIGRCAQCGAREPMGTAHAFQGAGMVLRCPHCDHALVTIVRAETHAWIGFPGAVTMEVPVGPS
jgi:DNA-directed RNA polymerase subunit RPC12/RpoP